MKLNSWTQNMISCIFCLLPWHCIVMQKVITLSMETYTTTYYPNNDGHSMFYKLYLSRFVAATRHSLSTERNAYTMNFKPMVPCITIQCQ